MKDALRRLSWFNPKFGLSFGIPEANVGAATKGMKEEKDKFEEHRALPGERYCLVETRTV